MAQSDGWQSGEKEQYWKNIRVVQLGEVFLLFEVNRNYTQIRTSDNHTFESIKSSIRLETGLFDTLNISLAATPHIIQRYSVITPFHREQGYPLDKDDLALRSRLAKISRLHDELSKTIEGMYLFVFATYEDMPVHSIMKALLDDGSGTLTREAAFILHHLFLTLTFPDGASFTARAVSSTHRLFLLFERFFPADTGPLPKLGLPFAAINAQAGNSEIESQESDKSEGFHMLLPFDLEKLKNIKAKFLFLPNLDE